MNKFHILGLNFAKICLKSVILETNFQKSPSVGGSSPPAPFKPSILGRGATRKNGKFLWRHSDNVI